MMNFNQSTLADGTVAPPTGGDSRLLPRVDAANVTVPMSPSPPSSLARGATLVQDTGGDPRNIQPVPGQARSPELRSEVQMLIQELERKSQVLGHVEHKAETYVQQQQQSFKDTARNFEKEARDVRNAEVAQEKAKLTATFSSQMGITNAQHSQNVQQLQQVVQTTRNEAEAALENQKQRITQEAREALLEKDKQLGEQRVAIVCEAETALQQQKDEVICEAGVQLQHAFQAEQRIAQDEHQKMLKVEEQLALWQRQFEAQAEGDLMQKNIQMQVHLDYKHGQMMQQEHSMEATMANMENHVRQVQYASAQQEAANAQAMHQEVLQLKRMLIQSEQQVVTEGDHRNAEQSQKMEHLGSTVLSLRRELDTLRKEKNDLENDKEQLEQEMIEMQDQMSESLKEIQKLKQMLKEKEPTGGDSCREKANVQRTTTVNAETQANQALDKNVAQELRVTQTQDSSISSAKENKDEEKAKDCTFESFPTVPEFKSWKFGSRKVVVAASNRPEKAFHWFSEIEKAKKIEDLENSGQLPNLDVQLNAGMYKVLTGEFKKEVQHIEEKMAKEVPSKMLKGRQITWLIYQKFTRPDAEIQIKNITDLVKIKMRGNNVRAFQNEWNESLLEQGERPSDTMLEALYLEQLENASQLNSMLALYRQDVTQKGETKSYQKLYSMVEVHLEESRKKKNKQQEDNQEGRGRSATPGNQPKSPKVKKGDCRQFLKHGTCDRGDDCPWNHDVEKANERRGAKGKGKKGKNRSRESSVESEIAKRQPSRGKSPSGEEDRPACREWMKGPCTKGKECNFWHPFGCMHFRRGKCKLGEKCKYRHVEKQKAGTGGDSRNGKKEDGETKPKGGGGAAIDDKEDSSRTCSMCGGEDADNECKRCRKAVCESSKCFDGHLCQECWLPSNSCGIASV